MIYRYNGKITMIPTDVMSQLLYYRSDLIPTPPQTWDEVMNQMVSATLDGKEPIPSVLERTNASLKALLPPKR